MCNYLEPPPGVRCHLPIDPYYKRFALFPFPSLCRPPGAALSNRLAYSLLPTALTESGDWSRLTGCAPPLAAFVCAVGAGKSAKGAECGLGGRRPNSRALPLDSCTKTCTSPKSLQRRELVQGNRRSARRAAGKRRKCTPKRASGGPSDVHFPAFLARNCAPARKRAKCTAACRKSREVHGGGASCRKESGEVHGCLQGIGRSAWQG